LVILLGLSAAAGLGLGLAVLPPAPQRTLDPAVRAPRAAPETPSAQSRAASRSLARYSARATPGWIQLGVALTAAGHHELAGAVEELQAGIRDARSAAGPDLAALGNHHRQVVALVRADPLADELGGLLQRLDGALPLLGTGSPPPRVTPTAEAPAPEALEGQLEGGEDWTP